MIKEMMPRKSIILMALALALAACVMSTPYAPIDGQYGYSEQRIEADRYRVVFNGDASTPRETVENYLLFRAAELTVQQSYDYFIVVEQETEATTTYQTTVPITYGHYPYGVHRFPYYAYGYSWSYEASTRERRRYEAAAYIVMRAGEKPADDPMAYDAREVMRNLGSLIERPSN